MVRQGDIVKVNLNPQEGHEQAGYRPAVVISNDMFNQRSNMTIICPITNTDRKFPLHIPLDDRTKTTGVMLCDQIRAVDLASRGYKKVERLPSDLLQRVINTVSAELENQKSIDKRLEAAKTKAGSKITKDNDKSREEER